jgi:hypothetical protein
MNKDQPNLNWNCMQPLFVLPDLNWKVSPYVPGGAKLGTKLEYLSSTVSPAEYDFLKSIDSECRNTPFSLTLRSIEVKLVSSSAVPV